MSQRARAAHRRPTRSPRALIRKVHGYNQPFSGPGPYGAHCLEEEGHFLLRAAFTPEEVRALREEVEEVYRTVPPDWRKASPTREHAEQFRYELFNRSPLVQRAICRREILELVEPLLGDDCHVISCTSWRNPAGMEYAPRGQEWHVDGGPYIARPPEHAWPDHIPYPIFVITTHIYLQDVALEDGPTAILPGSHRSGRLPPSERMWDVDLTYEGQRGDIHLANAGDVTLFVSDTWHRRMPTTPTCKGRFFVQSAYGRREVAQRLIPTERMGMVSAAARARAQSERELEVLGIHPQVFYDG